MPAAWFLPHTHTHSHTHTHTLRKLSVQRLVGSVFWEDVSCWSVAVIFPQETGATGCCQEEAERPGCTQFGFDLQCKVETSQYIECSSALQYLNTFFTLQIHILKTKYN